MAVEVMTSPAFEVGVSTPLFSDPYLRVNIPHQVPYAVSADGRFVMVETAAVEGEERRQPSIHVTQNWYEEFRDRE